ncbi:MAG: phosphatase PAP2-related protein [Patescibacteria group bacterium]
MNKALSRHRALWSQKKLLANLLLAGVIFVSSLLINQYANVYAASRASNSVSDIVLDNIPVVDVHLIYSEGAVLLIFLLILILLREPKYIIFSIKAAAIFILIRSFFIVLTHLATPIDELYINPNDFIQKFSKGQDLFFSAHTGFPFLFALVFWQNKYFRYLFLVASAIGGTAVLLGHLHYSIDVFSAPFIAFGIFHIAKKLFPKDYKLTA